MNILIWSKDNDSHRVARLCNIVCNGRDNLNYTKQLLLGDKSYTQSIGLLILNKNIVYCCDCNTLRAGIFQKYNTGLDKCFNLSISEYQKW